VRATVESVLASLEVKSLFTILSNKILEHILYNAPYQPSGHNLPESNFYFRAANKSRQTNTNILYSSYRRVSFGSSRLLS